MESFADRYRNLLVLLALLAAQLIGLAMQVHRTPSGESTLDASDSSGVRLLRVWAVNLVSPFEWVFTGATSGVGNLWSGYFDLRHSHTENQELKKALERMRLEQASLLEDALQGHRLQAQLGFQEQYIYQTQIAEVSGGSGTDHARVFYINKGSAEGIARDMAVILSEGIVGKVRDVYAHTSQVLAINDQASGAGVILETTRIRGILRGNANGEPQIVGILADQRIQPGEKVLTAGGDQIFPRGLPVGIVKKVIPDPDRDAFILVLIEPYVHLNRLDEVLVITAMQPRFSPEQLQDLATSNALKGPEVAAARDRLLQDQKKAAAMLAERLPGLIDPNAPPVDPSKPPLTGTSAPAPLKAKHLDRYSPASSLSGADAATDAAPAQVSTPTKKPIKTPGGSVQIEKKSPLQTNKTDGGR